MFEIYGRTNCVWCDRAKELLLNHGLSYSFRNIETNPSYLEDFLEDFKGKKTVPQIRIFIGNEYSYIGGYEELRKWLSTQKS